MNWTNTTLGLIGGLSLFLYGVTRLGEALQEVAGERMRHLLARMTQNPITGLLTGAAVTVLLDSSSVTIILVIALVHARVLAFPNALAVILGSNIGTTLSSQIFALSVDKYSPVLLFCSLLALYAGKGKAVEKYARAGVCVGLTFFGLYLMGDAMKPLAQSESFERWMQGLENPVRGVLAGAAGTAIIQSSSAMMGIVVKLAAAGAMTLAAGVAVMLGAEIGTCLDTLLASVGRSREAVRAGIFHLLFNVVTVTLGLLFYRPLAEVALWLPSDGSVSRQIANAHVFFNCAGAVLFLPLLGWCAKLLEAAIPAEGDFSGEAAPEPEIA